jgi:DNA mismatch repair protein MutL
MSKQIVILPPEIYQKIAAGEVVERPVSVVKELVENSLDAGAGEIKIELQGGGKHVIRVQDNGQGMSREDALLCFERHSTSKVTQEEDLDRISTLGFRGEALPSISAVSRVTLKTSDGENERATQVIREGEQLLGISDIAFPRGTSVEVKDLFFNLPARRKFLRSEQSELALIVKYMTLVALAFPSVRLTLNHGKRELLNCPPVPGLKERIFELYGASLLERLIALDFEDGARRVIGYSSRPPSGRADKSHQFFYVNKRPVRDRVLQAALNQAYKSHLEKALYPEAFLFVSLPCSEVDVNVHPAKSEVRFRDSQLIFYLVLQAVEQAVFKEKNIKDIYLTREKGMAVTSCVEEPHYPGGALSLPEEKEEQRPLFASAAAGRKTSPLVLGQYLNVYIIAAGEDGLLVIDQHNAHERVLYEKYREIHGHEKWPRRMSLLPLLLDLTPSQLLSFEAHQTLLEEAGFRLEAMGGRSFILKEFPDILQDEEAKEIFLTLLEELKEIRLEDKKDKLLATLACKTAVKAGQPLPLAKMEYLVEELYQTSNPALCPHGRPVVVKIDRAQIEKGLRRGSN